MEREQTRNQIETHLRALVGERVILQSKGNLYAGNLKLHTGVDGFPHAAVAAMKTVPIKRLRIAAIRFLRSKGRECAYVVMLNRQALVPFLIRNNIKP